MRLSPAPTIAGRIAQLRALALACGLMWLFFSVRNLTLDRPMTASVQAVGAVVGLLAWALAPRASIERHVQVIGHALLAGATCEILVNSLLNGATASTPFLLVGAPPFAAYVLGIRPAIVWAVITLAGSAGVAVVGSLALVRPEFTQGLPELILANYVPVYVTLLVLAIASRRATDGQIAKAKESEARVQKQADELLLARDVALEAGRAKSAFLANMSHELRTPLNAIIGMASVMDEAKLSPDQRDCIGTIRTSGETLLALISDILDFSKIEAGKVEIEHAPVELSHCIEDAIDLVAPAAAQKGLELTYAIEPGVPAWIATDRARLQQVLLNLLSNAVKFTDAGDVALGVSARSVGEGTYEVELRVQDDGIGIPEDKMDRLFRTFSQVDASTTRKYGGAGLGLAISKALVGLLGGTIRVESTPGRGSTFAFTIRADEAREPPGAMSRRSASHLVGLSVLVVCARSRLRDTVASHVTGLGATVTAVSSVPPEADVAPWDIAVVDAGAARREDLALAEELRRRFPMLPLVLLTPIGRQGAEALELVRREITGTVPKPVKPARLLSALLQGRSWGGPASPVSLTAGGGSDAPPHSPLRVLVAEDNLVNQRVQRRLLEQLGHRVDVVSDGLDAIESVHRRGYDAVFLDLQMPGLDGLGAARRIVAEWPRPGRPRLIALTANAGREDRAACLAAGMDDYLTKPVRLFELERALRGVTENPRLASIAAPAIGANGVLDPEVLAGLDMLEASSGEALIAPLVEVFFEDAPRRVAVLEAALARGDAQGVEAQAHSLKGSAGALGLVQVAALAGTIEGAAKARGVGAVADAGSRLREALDRAEPALRHAASRALPPRDPSA